MTDARIPKLAAKARQWRLAGDYHHGLNTEFPLVGYCFDNAYVTHHVLTLAGFSPVLVEGTTERVADDLIQSGITLSSLESSAELAGAEHYWIELPPTTDHPRTVIDIAADSFISLGQIIVTNSLPADYLRFPDSVSRGEDLRQHVSQRGDRCQYCGGERYTYGGCPRCAEELSSDLPGSTALQNPTQN